MKKSYILPTCETIKMNCEQMIAASQLSSGSSNKVTPGKGSHEGEFQTSKKIWGDSEAWK